MHGDIRETVVEFERGSKEILVSSTDSVWIKRIRKLCDAHPEETRIVGQDDVSICAKMPISYFNLRPKRKLNLTEEQIAERSERMRKIMSDRETGE